MFIEAQTQHVDCINTTSYTFNFGHPIDGYLIGLSSFSLSYKSGEDHDIWDLQISLSSSGATLNSITVNWTVTMKDHSQNFAKSGTLDITVLTYSGGQGLSLLSYSGVQHDTWLDQSPPMTSYGVRQAQAVLRGFNLSMGGTDERVSSIGVGVCAGTSTPTIMAGGTAFMTYDLNYGASATVDVGVIACTDDDLAKSLGLGVSPLRLTEVWSGKPNEVTPNPQKIPITHANYAYFMTGYYVTYDDGEKHHVANLAGTVAVTADTGVLEVTGTTIMNDKGGDPKHQNTGSSYIDAVVIQWDNPSS